MSSTRKQSPRRIFQSAWLVFQSVLIGSIPSLPPVYASDVIATDTDNTSESAPLAGQDPKQHALQGQWVGWLETPSQNLRLWVRIDKTFPLPTEAKQAATDSAKDAAKVPAPLAFEGSIVSPDQSADALPLADAALQPNGSLQFQVRLKGDQASGYAFQGKLEQDALVGELEQNGLKLPLTFNRATSLPPEGKERLGADSSWIGSLDVGGRKLPLRFRIYRSPPYATPSKPRILFDSLTEKANGFPVALTLKGDKMLEFSIPAIPGKAKYIAQWNETGERLVGRFQQGFLPLQLEMQRVSELADAPLASDALVQLIQKMRADAPPAVQPPWTEKEPQPSTTNPSAENAAEKRNSDANSLPEGVREEAFEIEIVDYAKPKIRRDGKRVPPSYKLSGTVTWPKTADANSRLPAVIMITGSGPQDRDETIGSHKPFRVLAHALAQRGMVSLRYDDRGVGESTGDFVNCTTQNFADDAMSVWRHAVALPGIDPRRVGLLGHSEGGIIAPLVASWQRDVAFQILLAPPGLIGGEILKSQIDRISELQGVGTAERTAANALQAQLQEVALKYDPSDDTVLAEVRELLASHWEELKALSATGDGNEDETKIKERVIESVTQQFQQLRSPWMRYFLVYDPAPNWLLFDCPTLALWGENDVQVLPELNRARIAATIERNTNLDAELTILPELNHLLQTSVTGLPNEYESIRETIAPAAIESILLWLKAREILK